MTPEIDLTEVQREVLRSVLRRYADRVDRVGVYGSRARGTARRGSDIDIVLHGSVDADTVARIRADLEDSNLSIFADVTALDSVTHPGLLAEIEQFARPLFDHAELIDGSGRRRSK